MLFQEALDKAKIGLIGRNNAVFLSTILFSLKTVENLNIPTACVDGITLEINPAWFLDMGPQQRVGLLAHECYHVAFMHMMRSEHLDAKRYNKAADHVINLILIAAGYSLPDGGLCDEQYRGMDTDQVYRLLPPTEETDNYDCDIKVAGTDGKGDDTTDAVTLSVSNILTNAVVQSKMQGDAPGTVPGECAIAYEKALNPKLPWEQLYRKYINAYVNNDHTFRKPNRRFFPDYHLPSMYSEGIDHFAYAIDASYSVSDDEFHTYLGEIDKSIKTLAPKKVTIVDFDTDIKSVHTLTEGQTTKECEFSGRGGTNINPVLNYFTENKPTVLVIFTDGYFDNNTPKVPYPIIWVIVDNPRFTAPYGNVIHYQTKRSYD